MTRSDPLIEVPEPGVPAGHPRPLPGSHPWAPSEFDRRESAPPESEQ